VIGSIAVAVEEVNETDHPDDYYRDLSYEEARSTPYSKTFDRLDALKTDRTSGLTWWSARPMPALQDVVRDGTSPGYLIIKPNSGWSTQPVEYSCDNASQLVPAIILVRPTDNLIKFRKNDFVNTLGFRFYANEDEIKEQDLSEDEKKVLNEIKRK
jgi:hypothetical protein